MPDVPAMPQAAVTAAVAAWRKAKAELERAKETETALRQKLTKLVFPDATTGTHRYDFSDSLSLKLVKSINYNLNNDYNLISQAYTKITQHCGGNQFLAKDLIKQKFTLSVAAYKKICDEADKDETYLLIRNEINQILTTSFAAPVLTVERING